MADQRKSVSEIIEEMRRELKEGSGEEDELFAPYIARPKKASAKKKPAKKAGKKAKPKKKPGKKAKKKPGKKGKGKRR